MRAAAHTDDTAADDLAALLAEEEAAGWLDDVDPSASRTNALQDLGDTADLPRASLPPKEPRKISRRGGAKSADSSATPPVAPTAAPAAPAPVEASTPAPIATPADGEQLAPLPRADRRSSPGGRRDRRVHRMSAASTSPVEATEQLEDVPETAEPTLAAPARALRHRRSGAALALGLGGLSLAATAAIAVAATPGSSSSEPLAPAASISGSVIGPVAAQLDDQADRLQTAVRHERMRASAQARSRAHAKARASARRRAKRAAARAAQSRAAAERRAQPAAVAAPRPSVRVAPVAPRISQLKRTKQPAGPACELGPC